MHNVYDWVEKGISFWQFGKKKLLKIGAELRQIQIKLKILNIINSFADKFFIKLLI
ncbi:hypothetical protein ZOSMA_357G00020 [Zostera marina]|uniref:Uncharacterized protein n=1 Tax=Zostera marina TaxID=29655 RepID=A0A0K9P912_ZOSMR|nr:hypothetical protein ZOSMA_357G00020 [Zostera marina]